MGLSIKNTEMELHKSFNTTSIYFLMNNTRVVICNAKLFISRHQRKQFLINRTTLYINVNKMKLRE